MKNTFPQISFIKILKNSKQILNNPLPFHRKNFEKYGDSFLVNLGFGNKILFTRDVGLAKHILKDQHKKFYKSPTQTNDLGKYIGHGLLTSNGEYWLKQRRLIQPAFYRKKLDHISKIMIEVVREELQQITTGEAINILPIMSNLAFKIVGRTLFSYKTSNDVIARLQKITGEIQIDVIKEVRQPYKKWWFYLKGDIQRSHKLAKEARNILQLLIEERLQNKQENNDLLDLLLASKYEDGSSMTMDQLIDEILILFVAGHETTSNALAFTLMLLAQHPEIQDQVFSEVNQFNVDEVSMKESFLKYEFTKKCIDESLRIYPPAYFVDRIAVEANKFKHIKLPKKATILISFFEIHRNKEFWKNPESFNPNRFNTENKKDMGDYYYPFGAGPRMCIGSNFAYYEMIITMAEIIKNFKITPNFENIEIKPLITLIPKNAFLKFEKRN